MCAAKRRRLTNKEYAIAIQELNTQTVPDTRKQPWHGARLNHPWRRVGTLRKFTTDAEPT